MIGQTVGRYRVISKLGAGGMGEVYLARDESLDRSVALKILPPDLVRNDERVRRFVQEAKSASSLSHPHIVTIYEIGEAEVSGSDAAPAETIHFIAMELVSGHTLKTLIHQEKTELKTLVRYLAQAADGLAKAHAAGIVHRDLKPENIMVTSDGFAKVLDFGLAKLTETSGGSDDAATRTELARGTGAGMMLGTIGYMSPEQVQGKTVDHRSDIFSLGCVLYEAATRQRPFEADSDVETLHKILKERPRPIEELNPDVPGELRRVIRRCLAKSPDQRWQGMKDLALELAELADEYDTLSASSGSGTQVSSGVMGEAPASGRTRAIVAVAAVTGIVGLAALGYGLWLTGRSEPGGSSPPIRLERVMSSPDVERVALSPDGRRIAYVRRDAAGQFSLRVRQIATGNDVELLPLGSDTPRTLGFTPDGDYLQVMTQSAGGQAIIRVPAIGGPPRRADVPPGDWAVSPDGRQIAGIRRIDDDAASDWSLRVVTLDGGGERSLARLRSRGWYPAPTWSPDGASVVAAVWETEADGRSALKLVAYDIDDGRQHEIGTSRWGLAWPTWLGDGSGLIVRGTFDDEAATPNSRQLWHVSYPNGAVRRLTNDVDSFTSETTSADGRTVAALQQRRAARVWVAPAGDLGGGREVSMALSADEAPGLLEASDAQLFLRIGRSIWRAADDGARPMRLTPESLEAQMYRRAHQSGELVFESGATDDGGSRTVHLWQVEEDGSGLRQVTSDVALPRPLAIAPEGQAVLFQRSDSETGGRELSTLWRLSLAGGEPTLFYDADDRRIVSADYSPDGRQVVVMVVGETGSSFVILPPQGGAPAQTIPAPEGSQVVPAVRWAPTGGAIDVVRRVDGLYGLWRQPVGGAPAQHLMTFSEATSPPSFAWTPDGSRLFYTRDVSLSSDVLILSNFR